jgi:hypothetical protein
MEQVIFKNVACLSASILLKFDIEEILTEICGHIPILNETG